MRRNHRYLRAKHWAEWRARAFPGVRFTASFGPCRLSCWTETEGGAVRYHQWYVWD